MYWRYEKSSTAWHGVIDSVRRLQEKGGFDTNSAQEANDAATQTSG
jgi:hypothetical protein